MNLTPKNNLAYTGDGGSMIILPILFGLTIAAEVALVADHAGKDRAVHEGGFCYGNYDSGQREQKCYTVKESHKTKTTTEPTF